MARRRGGKRMMGGKAPMRSPFKDAYPHKRAKGKLLGGKSR